MEQLAAILLIVGCSEDLASCQQVPAPVPIYASAEECEASLPDAVGSQIDGFPQILAKCVTTEQPQGTRLRWNVSTEGHLFASAKSVSDYLAQLDAPVSRASN